MKQAQSQDPKTDYWESKLVFDYFGCRKEGVFVEVGANHPIFFSLTYFLEQQGWSGVLVEPNPKLCSELRKHRPQSQVVEVAACAPSQVGEADLHLDSGGGGHYAIKPSYEAVLTGGRIRVVMRTLDSVLAEARVRDIDFVSLDVEGMELDVLQGFNLAQWRPRLLLIEDFFRSHAKHHYLKHRGYKLVRRTGYNNWYVPRESPASLLSVSTTRELFRLGRKFWFGPAYYTIRRTWKRYHSS